MNFNHIPTDTDLKLGHPKVLEYVKRFQAGALDREDMTKDHLGPFYNDVITTLIDLIPPKYRGENWPPELVAEMWNPAVPVDYDEVEQQRTTRGIALHAYALRWDSSSKQAPETSPELATPKSLQPESALIEKEVEIPDTINTEEVPQKTEIIQNDEALTQLVDEVSAKLSAPARALYQELLTQKNDPEKRALLVKAVLQGVYNGLRLTEYQKERDEEVIYQEARSSNRVSVREENNWMYRGEFTSTDEGTLTRGSLNVRVTRELVASLDNLITSGVIKANYKFGQPDTSASPSERHDAISLYFLEEPSPEALQKITDVITPFVRGNNLLGKKISEGFYLSEIGSIKNEHIPELITLVDSIDPGFAQGIKMQTAQVKDGPKMSEAQFYALEKTALAFGYTITYSKEEGFDVTLTTHEQQTDHEQSNQTNTEQPQIAQLNEVPEVSIPTIDIQNVPAEEAPTNEPSTVNTSDTKTVENSPSTTPSPEQDISSAEEMRLREIRAFAQGLEHFCKINDTRASEGYSRQFMPQEKLRDLAMKSQNFVEALTVNDIATAEATLHSMLVDFDAFGRSENRTSNVEDNLRSLQELTTNLADTHAVLGTVYRRYSSEHGDVHIHKLLDTIDRFGRRLDRARDLVKRLEELGRDILRR